MILDGNAKKILLQIPVYTPALVELSPERMAAVLLRVDSLQPFKPPTATSPEALRWAWHEIYTPAAANRAVCAFSFYSSSRPFSIAEFGKPLDRSVRALKPAPDPAAFPHLLDKFHLIVRWPTPVRLFQLDNRSFGIRMERRRIEDQIIRHPGPKPHAPKLLTSR